MQPLLHYSSLNLSRTLHIGRHWCTSQLPWIDKGSMVDICRVHQNIAEGYCNMDWGGQKHCHLISSYSSHVGVGTVSWSLRKWHIIALLSTEVEYVMQTHAAKRSAVAAQLPQQTSELLTINCDNQGVIALSKDNKFHAQTRHTKICYYFICGAVEDTKIEVIYIPMDNNVSDIFMKPLTSSALQNWSRKFKFSFFLWTHSLKGSVEYFLYSMI